MTAAQLASSDGPQPPSRSRLSQHERQVERSHGARHGEHGHDAGPSRSLAVLVHHRCPTPCCDRLGSPRLDRPFLTIVGSTIACCSAPDLSHEGHGRVTAGPCGFSISTGWLDTVQPRACALGRFRLSTRARAAVRRIGGRSWRDQEHGPVRTRSPGALNRVGRSHLGTGTAPSWPSLRDAGCHPPSPAWVRLVGSCRGVRVRFRLSRPQA